MELDEALRIAAGRLRAARATRLAERAVIGGAIATVVYVVVAHVVGGWPTGWWFAAVPLVAGLLGFLLGWAGGGVSRFEAAVAVDRRLDLQERVATSTWLSSSSSSSSESDRGSSRHQEYVRGMAAAKITTVPRERIREAFRLPRIGKPAIASCVAVVASLALSPLFLTKGEAGADPTTRLIKEREAQRVRESARKLAKNAAEVARAADLAKLEEARTLARMLEQEARKMANSPPSKRDALSNLARLSASIRNDVGEQLGVDAGDRAFGSETGEFQSGELAALSEFARELDQLDPDGLSLDLDEYRRSLGLELDQSRAEDRPPVLDEAATRDLMDRLRDMEDVLRQMEQTLKEQRSSEYQRLSQETADLMRRIREKLGQMGEYSSSCSGSGSPAMDEEELRKMLKELMELLDSMSAEDLEQLMDMLSEARLGQSMEQLIGQCRSEIGGSLGQMSDGELSRMLQALSQMQSRRPGRSARGGGKMEAQANGGGPGRGPDDGAGMDRERVRGKLDPTGDLGDAVPFRGVPKPVDAKRAFDEAVDRAASAAEESLGRDLLPPDAKPFVRRYFEALREATRQEKAVGGGRETGGSPPAGESSGDGK